MALGARCAETNWLWGAYHATDNEAGSMTRRGIEQRDRRLSLVTVAVLAGTCVSGCALLSAADLEGLPTARPATPVPSPTRRPPSRWMMRFCDAQIWVARAFLRIDQAHRRLDRGGTRSAFEDAGDDLADQAERAIDFLRVVPKWRPSGALVDAERAMLRVAVEAGELMEEVAEAGMVAPASSQAVREAMTRLRRAMRELEPVIDRAVERGIPCAKPTRSRPSTTCSSRGSRSLVGRPTGHIGARNTYQTRP